MADTLRLQIVDPERSLVDESVEEVQVPARDGYIGVLPGHAPLISELMTGGVLTFRSGGKETVLALFGGFVEVLPDRVRVLADCAEHRTEIDPVKAEKELEEAMKAIEQMHGEADPAVALEQMQRAQAKVDAVGRK